jgi:gamma-glutamyltranspeptidase/glutathione hydrolase
VAAALGVTEPFSTGIGGDAFCLFFDAKTRKVHSLNGSGRSSAHLDLQGMRRRLNVADGEKGAIPLTSALAVSVPGAAAAWCDTLDKFGSGAVTLTEVLSPAERLARGGWPVSEISAYWVSCALEWYWKRCKILIGDASGTIVRIY